MPYSNATHHMPGALLRLTVAAFMLWPACIAQAQDVQRLRTGEPLERTIAPGETHSYAVEVASGDLFRFAAEQEGIDLVLKVFAPDGSLVDEYDSPTGDQGTESFKLIAAADGRYRIDVFPLLKKAPEGRYEAQLVEVRPATGQELARVAAEKEILKLEKAWDDAVVQLDVAAQERIAAPDYLFFSPEDKALNYDKEMRLQIARMDLENRGEERLTSQNDDVTVRVYGNTAVVTGRTNVASWVDGKEYKRPSGRFMHVWMKRKDAWRLVADQYFPAAPRPVVRTSVKLDRAILDDYAGRYTAYGHVHTVSTAPGGLQVDFGEQTFAFLPESETEFFLDSEELDVQLAFVRDSKGRTTHAYLIAGGRMTRLAKVD